MQNQGIITCSQAAGFVWYLKVTGAVTQKHVKIVRRRKRRAKEHRCHKIYPRCSNRVLLVGCKCTEKFPALIPADLLHGQSQMTSMKRNTKINFSSVSCELVSFPMEEQQRIINISSEV